MARLEDRFIGCLIGGAVGDALAMPTEDITKKEHQLHYGGRVAGFVNPLPGHPNAHLRAGQYTDDTQQILILAESITSCQGFDIKEFGKRSAEWGVRNQSDRNYWRYPGGTSMSAALALHRGADPYSSGSTTTTSCGSAMRAGPVGLHYHKDLEKTVHFGKLSSIPTHNSPVCIDGAAAVASVVALLVRGESPFDAVAKTLEYITEPLMKMKISTAIHLSKNHPETAAAALGTTSSVLDTVPFAVYCFLHSPDDFQSVMITAVNAVPGDTDSFGCIAGKFAGAYLGYERIPKAWAEGVEDSAKIKGLAMRLCAL